MKHVVILLVALVLVATATREQFAEFQKRFGKVYASAEEEAKRFAIFEHNMKIAAKHQAANPHATFGINEYSDVSASEFKIRHNLDQHKAQRPSLANLPPAIVPKVATVEKIDWRTKGAVVAIKNQGQCGSCWSFGTVAGIEGQWFLAGNTLTSLSEQEFVSCDTTDYGCNGGYPSHAMEWDLQNRGGELVTEASYPYVSGNGEVPACSWEGTKFGAKIDGYKKLPQNEKEMAAYCGANGPITILVDASSFQTYVSGILTNCISVQIDHCVAIVGFDLTNSPPYWIIKNSWGTSWGEEGYIRVEYGTNQCLITDGPIIGLVKSGPQPPTPQPVPTPAPPVTPAPAGPAYVVNCGGAGCTAPEGYELASLDDIKSSDFQSFINAGNLNDQGETNVNCCAMAVKDGFLTYDSSPVTYLGPYMNDGEYDCALPLTNPVYLGSTVGGGLPNPDFLSPLTGKIADHFKVASALNPNLLPGCDTTSTTFGIYKLQGGPTPAPGNPTPSPAGGLHFEVYGAGTGFNAPTGYRLASIEELQTEDFMNQVNNGKLLDQGETVAGCCCLAVKGGYLVSKNTPDTYLGAYMNGGSYDCAEVLTNPVYIGTSVNGGLPYPDWLNPLTKAITSQFTTQPNFEPLYASGCTAGQPTWGIYVKGAQPPTPPPGPKPVIDPPFIVAGYGKDFATAPEGYELADLFTIKKKFVDFYNEKKLNSTGAAMNGCCVFATYDGFLTVGSPASFIGPYSKDGNFDCKPKLDQPVYIGTEDGGQYPNIFAKSLNQSTVDLFTASKTVDPRLCQDVHNSYAIYMLKKKI